MGVGEAFHIGQFAVGRRIVIDRVFGRQILLVLCDRALLNVDRKGEGVHASMGHLPVDLRDAVVLDPVEGVRAMDVQLSAERVTVFLHCERIFPLRLFKASWSTMDGDHAQLLLCPLLNLAVVQLNGDLAGTLDDDRASGFFSVHIDGEVSCKPRKIFRPPGGLFERSAQEIARLRIIGDGRRFLYVPSWISS